MIKKIDCTCGVAGCRSESDRGLRDGSCYCTEHWQARRSKLKPGAPVDQWMVADGVGAWVCGYAIFDPEHEYSTIGGHSPLKLRRQASGEELLIQSQQSGGYWVRPVRLSVELVRPSGAGAVTFAAMFGQSGGGAVVVSGASFDQVEDLDEEMPES